MKNAISARTQWIDCVKFVAILLVLIDHTYKVLYTDFRIGAASWSSVSLFVLVAGYTLYQSAVRRNAFGYRGLWRRIRKILLPYLLAVFLIEIATTGRFDWEYYWNHVFHFSITGPHYYVLLYIQMLIVAPVLINALRLNRRGSTTVTLLVVLVISSLTTENTNILNIYGGGAPFRWIIPIFTTFGYNSRPL